MGRPLFGAKPVFEGTSMTGMESALQRKASAPDPLPAAGTHVKVAPER